MRFGSDGNPNKTAAPQLKAALAGRGVELVVMAPGSGADITREVFGTMKKCDGFVVFGTPHYGEATGNAASTEKELAFWQNTIAKKHPAKKMILINMLRTGEDFEEIVTEVLFGTNNAYELWPMGSALPSKMVDNIAKAFGK